MGHARPRRVSDDAAVRQRARRSSPAPAGRARAAAPRWPTPACATGVAVPCAATRIVGVATRGRAARRASRTRTLVDCERGVLTPGLRRLAHARRLRPRALRGAGAARRRAAYMEIARRGGGIHASVRDLRDARRGRAVRARRAAARRARRVRLDDGRGEVRLRALARRRAQDAARDPAPRRARCRCASCRPGSARTRSRSSTASATDGRREYVDLLVHEMLPAVARGAARALRRRLLRARRLHRRRDRARSSPPRAPPGCGIKLHADELSAGGGAELAGELGATSADHLAAVRDAGIAALAAAGPWRRCCPARCSSSASDQAPARRLISRRAGRAGDGLQSGHLAHHQLSARPHARGQPAAARRRPRRSWPRR